MEGGSPYFGKNGGKEGGLKERGMVDAVLLSSEAAVATSEAFAIAFFDHNPNGLTAFYHSFGVLVFFPPSSRDSGSESPMSVSPLLALFITLASPPLDTAVRNW